MKIDLYVRVMCPTCDMIMNYLDINDVPYNSYIIDHMSDHELHNLVTYIAPGAKIAPIILVENKERTINELRELIETRQNTENKIYS